MLKTASLGPKQVRQSSAPNPPRPVLGSLEQLRTEIIRAQATVISTAAHGVVHLAYHGRYLAGGGGWTHHALTAERSARSVLGGILAGTLGGGRSRARETERKGPKAMPPLICAMHHEELDCRAATGQRQRADGRRAASAGSASRHLRGYQPEEGN